MSSVLTVIYEFDRFKVDRGNQRLTRDGLLILTPGKTLPLLLDLIENRDQVISHEKLISTFFSKSPNGEDELVSEIAKLKRLLDDTQKRAPIIRNIDGQGYQFEAEVTEYLGDKEPDQPFGGTAEEAKAAAPASNVPAARKKTGLLGVAVALVLAVAIGFGVWKFLPGRVGASKSSGPPQVAILPFQSLTGAQNDNTFNRSLTDGIISALQNQPGVQVVPESSVQRYLDSGAADPVTAGRELGAQIIVRGMAQRLAGHILVKVQLISTDDGSQVWSNGFEGDAKDIAGLSAQISEKIGKGLPGNDTTQQQ